jgi:DHA1 family tetracycline resistance protein-like MFS transporter
MFFLQFFQFFLMEKFQLNILEQGLIIGFCGLWMAISQGLILRFLTRFFKTHNLLLVSLPLLSLAYLSLLLPQTVIGMYIVIPILIIFQGITFPSILSIISNKASRINQGETIGINQSVQSMASALPALLVASFVSEWINFPLYFGAICTLIATFIFALEKKHTDMN